MFPKPERKKKPGNTRKTKKKTEKSKLLFPKEYKRKTKKHKKSILQPKADRRCYLCMLLDQDYSVKRYLEENHVLYGNDHAFAEAEGLKVNLCLRHHRNSPVAVHDNMELAELLMPIAQEIWERKHTREEWMLHVKKNYLDS